MQVRVIQPGTYNDQFNKAGYYEVDEVIETLPAYGASLVGSGYVVPDTDDEPPIDVGNTHLSPPATDTDIPPLVDTEPTTEEDSNLAFVDELRRAGVSLRAANSLQIAGYRNWENLTAAPDDELLAVAWVGERALKKIRRGIVTTTPGDY